MFAYNRSKDLITIPKKILFCFSYSLNIGDDFLTVGWMTAVVVEVLMGVCRFSVSGGGIDGCP